jgi:hypothetical protein
MDILALEEKSKQELLDIIAEEKKKARKRSHLQYLKCKEKRKAQYLEKKKMHTCECGRRIDITSLKVHQTRKCHMIWVKEQELKKKIEEEKNKEIAAEPKQE